MPDSLAIIRAFHAANLALNLALRANVWFNYVASKANVAVSPTSLRGTRSARWRTAFARSTLPSPSTIASTLSCPRARRTYLLSRTLSVLWAAVMHGADPVASHGSPAFAV